VLAWLPVNGLRFTVTLPEVQVPGSRFRVPGSGFKVPGSRFRVPGFKFLVLRSRERVSVLRVPPCNLQPV